MTERWSAGGGPPGVRGSILVAPGPFWTRVVSFRPGLGLAAVDGEVVHRGWSAGGPRGSAAISRPRLVRFGRGWSRFDRAWVSQPLTERLSTGGPRQYVGRPWSVLDAGGLVLTGQGCQSLCRAGGRLGPYLGHPLVRFETARVQNGPGAAEIRPRTPGRPPALQRHRHPRPVRTRPPASKTDQGRLRYGRGPPADPLPGNVSETPARSERDPPRPKRTRNGRDMATDPRRTPLQGEHQGPRLGDRGQSSPEKSRSTGPG